MSTKVRTLVHGVTGSALNLYGVQKVQIDFDVNQGYVEEFMVTDLPKEYIAIVGYDLLRKWNAVIDLPFNTLRLSQGTV